MTKILFAAFALFIGSLSGQAPAPSQFLMGRDAEIALARSAAPSAISGQATVIVLGAHGYETAAAGRNGWVCGVERAWMNQFDSKDFWNPRIRGAICYNPAAARSVLPLVELRARLVMAGKSKPEILAGVEAALAHHQVPALEAGAMSYMTSKHSYLSDAGNHDLAHLMFYAPMGEKWGADLPHSPVSRIPVFGGAPEPIAIYIVKTDAWSDGTPAG